MGCGDLVGQLGLGGAPGQLRVAGGGGPQRGVDGGGGVEVVGQFGDRGPGSGLQRGAHAAV